MDVCFLGTGASYSRGKRQNTSLLIKAQKKRILIDCSGFPEFSLAKHNVKVSEISDVILTHSHVDHIYALPSLIHTIRLNLMPQGGGSVRLFALPETLRVTKDLIDVFGLREKKNPVRIDFKPLLSSEGYIDVDVEGIKIEYFCVCHGSTPTIGLSISENKNHLLFSSDSEICQSIIRRIKPSTILIHDCGSGMSPQNKHAGADELSKMLSNHPCKRLFLCHLPDLSEEKIDEIKKVIKYSFNGELIFPGDGDIFSF